MVGSIVLYFLTGFAIWAIVGMTPVLAVRRGYGGLFVASLVSGFLWLAILPVLALGVTPPGIAYVVGAAIGEVAGAVLAHQWEDKREGMV